MNDRHDRIEELLAGYVLQSLSGDDAREADRLLSDHVPGCSECRETLAAFQALTGDLALAAPPVAPPDTLLPRLRREMQDRPARPRRALGLLLGAAAVVVVIGLASLSMFLNARMSGVVEDRNTMDAAFSRILSQDGSRMVTLKNPDSQPTMLAVFEPGQPRAAFAGANVPAPADGDVYRIWVIDSSGTAIPLTSFVPDDEGNVFVAAPIDLAQFNQVVCTEEPAESEAAPGALPPDPGAIRWTATIRYP